MLAANFRELLSGRARGLGPGLLRALLFLAEGPYALATRLRNARYDLFPALARRVKVPVISVGNLTTGGTGKTPLVAYLARLLRQENVRVSIVSRGYGAQSGAVNDEALELEYQLPDVPHLQNPDRFAAARAAIEELETQFVLLDDAFQHRRMHRDLDLVLLDALEPFGYDHLLPRGLLRESLSGLARASAVVLSRADLVSPARREEIHRTVNRYAPRAAWIEAAHRPRGLLVHAGNEEPLDRLQGARVIAFCGIGNPAGFRETLSRCGCRDVLLREFPDHHAYSRADIEAISAETSAAGNCDLVVCTHKDLVKVGLRELGGKPLRALTVGIELLSGGEALEALLAPLVAKALRSDVSGA